MKNIKISIIIFVCFCINNLVFAQVQKIDFSNGKIIIDGAANLNLEGYDGQEVLILDTYYEQNRPDLEEGLTKINSRKTPINADISYKISGNELRLKTDLKTSRYVIKVPKNLTVSCITPKGDYYYYDGLKSMNISNIEGEIEVNCQGGVDVTISDITNSVSVVTYGNITATVESLPTSGSLSFDTYLGYVNLSLPHDGKANLNLSSKKGDIFSNLNINKTNKTGKAKQVIATLGNGGVDVIVNAEAGGDIYLRKMVMETTLSNFVHEPNAKHYMISLAKNATDITDKRGKIKPASFMRGMTHLRNSSLNIGDQTFLITRHFDNFNSAFNFANSLNDGTLEFVVISQNNYRTLLKDKSFDKYVSFYKNLIR